MNKTNTWLPIFPGFYNTIFETDTEESEIEYYNEQRAERGLPPLEYHDFTFDYATRNYEIAQCACEFIKQALAKFGVLDVAMEKVVSPRQYNFTNDSIDCVITYDEAVVQKYINEHIEEFKQYLRGRYTSRDGFASFYSADVEDWKEWSGDKHMVGSVLDFICRNEEIDQEAMYYSGASDVTLSLLNYDEIIPKTEGKAV